MQDEIDGSASGYIVDSFEGISLEFTDVEILNTSENNIVARAKRYGRWWLLKGLNNQVANEVAYQQRLRKELELMMQLQHPHIVAAVGLEKVKGIGNCIVMEYIDGVTLNKWLQQNHSRKERRRIALEIVDAVKYIHSKGIVHRDLKPDNIIITTNGDNVKLIDFGLADTDSHAILKQPAGTIKYMSPEQLQTSVADVRNDIYSLGIIFKQMYLGYNTLLKKCLSPIEIRYQNIEELHEAIIKQNNHKNRCLIAFICFIIFLSFCTIIFQMTNMQKEFIFAKSQADSLKTIVNSLNDSIVRIKLAENAQAMYMQQKYLLLQNGKKTLDDKLSVIASDLKELELWDFDSKMKIYEKLTEYGDATLASFREQVRNQLEEKDLQDIMFQLEVYKSEQQQKWIERINKTFLQH